MTARQDHIDAMTRYYELHSQYYAVLDKMSEPEGLRLSQSGSLRITTLGDRVEDARQQYLQTMRVWMESREG
jgi:hypothetical protein